MGKVKLILGEMSFEEFEAKCKIVLEMMSSEEYDLTDETLDIFKDVYTSWIFNGGHETINKIVNDLGELTDENTEEYDNKVQSEIVKWIKDII